MSAVIIKVGAKISRVESEYKVNKSVLVGPPSALPPSPQKNPNHHSPPLHSTRKALSPPNFFFP